MLIYDKCLSAKFSFVLYISFEYINFIRLISYTFFFFSHIFQLFMACLCSLQALNILNEVDRTKLFSNITDIYAANRFFWCEHVLGMVNATRSSGHPLDPGHLLNGFETFEQTFAPYTRYCSEQSKCQQYCRERLNDNELFTAYLVVRNG